MTAICGEDGEWRPNPGDVECRKNDTLSTGITIYKAYIGVFVCELAVPRNIHSKMCTFLHYQYNYINYASTYQNTLLTSVYIDDGTVMIIRQFITQPKDVTMSSQHL